MSFYDTVNGDELYCNLCKKKLNNNEDKVIRGSFKEYYCLHCYLNMIIGKKK